MEKVTLPGMPARRAQDYAIEGGRFARVIYVPQENRPDMKRIEAQAYEVNAAGAFVPAAEGYPSRTPGTQHTIAATGLGDTHTLTPGWVREVGYYNTDTLPEGTLIATQLPASGDIDERVFVEPHLYRFDMGEVARIMEGKAKELADLLRQADALAEFEL
jgi:hypothetical protein